MDGGAVIFNVVYFPFQHIFRQPVTGDSPAEQTTGFRRGFKNIALISHPAQEVGGGEAGRPGPGNGDFPAVGRKPLQIVTQPFFCSVKQGQARVCLPGVSTNFPLDIKNRSSN